MVACRILILDGHNFESCDQQVAIFRGEATDNYIRVWIPDLGYAMGMSMDISTSFNLNCHVTIILNITL